jgi:CheY-like chemotaxis protein/Tfp pilus assembly protein PilZ
MAEHKKKGDQGEKTDRNDHLVLVVDDNQKRLSTLCTLLVRFGYQIVKATTSRQALATSASLVPSLIMISLDLDDMNGFKLVRQLKKSPVTAHIPLLSYIERHSDDLRDRCLEHGAVGYLCQPIEPEMLFNTVQAAIEKNPRSSMRIRTTLPVKVYGISHETLYGAYTLALSAGGMFLRTMSPVAVNSELSLEFDLDGHPIAADGVVLYNCQAGPPCGESGIGLRFTEIAPKDEAILRQFIRSEMTKGLPLETSAK